MVLTGEYPPQPGGVSDYTARVVTELRRCGDDVHVWAPGVFSDASCERPGLTRLRDHFGRGGRGELSRALEGLPRNARLLVQYVPQAFGRKGMNVSFCVWVWRQARKRPVDVMFHEVATPWGRGLGWRAARKHVLALTTRIMAALVARRAANIYLSIPAWKQVLSGWVPAEAVRRAEWLPVPSTVPEVVDGGRAEVLRHDLLSTTGATLLVGHFGTFGGHIARGLQIALPEILRQPSVGVVLVGRGSVRFVEVVANTLPQSRERVIALGAVAPESVAEHLAACDCLVQPYMDGVSSRRTSLMAGLALGKPIVTMTGFLSEPIWKESNAVRLVDSFEEMPSAVSDLLGDPVERARLARAAADLYREHFGLERTIEKLRAGATTSHRKA